jgi:hypothetical protein
MKLKDMQILSLPSHFKAMGSGLTSIANRRLGRRKPSTN